MFRPLVSITCLAVLAFIGYYFVGEYQRHQAAADDRLAAAYERTLMQDGPPTGGVTTASKSH